MIHGFYLKKTHSIEMIEIKSGVHSTTYISTATAYAVTEGILGTLLLIPSAVDDLVDVLEALWFWKDDVEICLFFSCRIY
jgi:hypothetical protein